MNDLVHQLACKVEQETIALRRHFHRHPEVGWQEVATQQKILSELEPLGFSIKKAAQTGVIAELTSGRPGKTVVVRADIDALPLDDECGQPYQSQNSGVCHACGHDAHMAMLLGVAKVCAEMKDQLSGTVRFVFQPAEECFPGGAQRMIAEGVLAGADAVFGAHVWQTCPVGTIGVAYGPMMAAADSFTLTVQGKGGHGSMPHQTIDALLVGIELAAALNTIVSRNIDPMETAVLSLGAFQAGEAFNIIPDTAVIKGTVRSFKQEVRQLIFDRIEQIAQGICSAHGARYELERTGIPAVINHQSMVDHVVQAARQTVGADNVHEITPVMGGEDFAYYLQQCPGAFFFVGIGNEAKGGAFPHHHPKFDLDEDGLRLGVEVMVRSVLQVLLS